MIKYELFRSHETRNETYEVCIALLKQQGLDFRETIDPKSVMVYSQGKLNPQSGFCIVFVYYEDRFHGEKYYVGQNIFDLCKDIEKRGLKRL